MSRLVAVLGYSPRGGGRLDPVCAARLLRAAELAREDDLVLLSGWSRRPGWASEAELMARAWAGRARELVREPNARHTVGNAAAVAALARARGVAEVVVVTSWWHRPRAVALVRAALRGSGTRVRGVGARSPVPPLLLARELACLAALPVQLAAVRPAR